MKHCKTPFFILLLCLQITFAQNQNVLVPGTKFSIKSSILNEERICLISLPESYNDAAEATEKYPVLILLDGSAFFKTTAGIVHFMSSSRNRNYLMPETIIVAIENVDRERDFTVTKLKTTRKNRMGGGTNFLNFIEKELLPYIDENYRTESHRTLVGHSLAGLLTINSYLDENSLFDAYVSVDPSLWWDEEIMKDKVDGLSPKSLKKKVYIATANQGASNYERNQKKHNHFVALLNEKWGESANVKLEYFEDEDHRSVPLKGIYEGLKYLNDDKQ